MSPALRAATRRGGIPLGAGLASLLLAWPATGSLDRVLTGLGTILAILGLVIVVTTTRTLSATRADTRADPESGPRRGA